MMDILRESWTSPTAKIMVVSDDPQIAAVWVFALQQIGLQTSLASLGEEALESWNVDLPDLVVVDSHAWQMEDIEFCRRLRSETIIPIMLFTSQNDEYYLLEGYKAGIDEVVAQPVSPRLFLAKVRAWLRHVQETPISGMENLCVGDLQLDPDHRLLRIGGNGLVHLTHLETRLLYQLMSHPRRTLETPVLVERVWGRYGEGDSALLKNLVYRLRRKIEPDPSRPRYLLTEGAIGYCLQVD
jgi:DNA-binding response OmpR family regulator